MSKVAIRYSDLEDSTNYAYKLSESINDYASDLEKKVLNKIQSYEGYNENEVYDTSKQVLKRIDNLKEKAYKTRQVSKRLHQIREECEKTDRNVSIRIKNFSEIFCKEHNIKIRSYEKCSNYIQTSIVNKTIIGRNISKFHRNFEKKKDEIKNDIKIWYDFEGGEDFIKGVLSSVGKIALEVALIVAALSNPISFGALLTIGLSAIGILDGCADFANELNALCYNKGLSGQPVDPALAKRCSNRNRFTDTLRLSNDKKMHKLADFVDGTECFLSLASIFRSGFKNSKTIFKQSKTILKTNSLDFKGMIIGLKSPSQSRKYLEMLKVDKASSLLSFDIVCDSAAFSIDCFQNDYNFKEISYKFFRNIIFDNYIEIKGGVLMTEINDLKNMTEDYDRKQSFKEVDYDKVYKKINKINKNINIRPNSYMIKY